MMIRRLLPLLLIGILWPVLSYAQSTTPTIVVLHTNAIDQGAEHGLLVRNYFTLRDTNGVPILKRDVRLDNEGTITLLGDNRAARASISEPDAPIKIVLLLDASGSMRNHIDVARDAALQALDSAPERAQFFIYQFTTLDLNTRLGGAESFSSNRQFWRSEVGAWRSVSGAGTCLYNAVFQAVQMLADSAQPEERRAVILFTDGVDELSSGVQCSERGAENAILRATDKNIPIYTIGLCESQSCRSIDEAVLSRMARDTKGAAVVGVADQMEDRFSEIMQILDSQWVAEATIYPRSGPNTATIQVQMEGSEQPISGIFTVDANFDYYPPPRFNPTVSRDEAIDQYILNLQPSNTQALGSVTLTIKDTDAGIQHDKRDLALDAIQTGFPISATDFQSGHEYCFQIQATNRDGQPFELGAQEIDHGADPTVLAEACIKHELRLQIDIVSVTPNWSANKLVIQLALPGIGQRQLLVDLDITNKSGAIVADLPPVAPDAQGQILIDIPPTLQRAGAQDEFIITVRAEVGGQIFNDSSTFRITPRPGLNSNWLLVIGVPFFAALGGWGYISLRNRKPKGLLDPKPIEGISNPETGRVNDPQPQPKPKPPQKPRSKQVRVRLRVIETPNPTQRHDVEVTSSPFVIGRSQDTGVQLPILGDPHISGTHLHIHMYGSEVKLTDVSSYGTFIAGKKLTNEYVLPMGSTRVHLGPKTVIEITLM